MKFVHYSLKVGNNLLINDLNISFQPKVINHLLGNNGVGKSCLAKSCVGMMQYSGKIEACDKPALIGSYSNIPLDFKLKDIIKILKVRFETTQVSYFYELLQLDKMPINLNIKKMSDGQKQKIKLLCFLIPSPKIIILDEFTSALDKSSTLEIYKFLNEYVTQNDVTCINITHNLSDIEYMPGNYYFFSNKNIVIVDSKQEIIDLYMRGGLTVGK